MQQVSVRRSVTFAIVALLVGSPAMGSFATFESGQVRPLTLSPDGTRLFAVNTPDDRLEIFSVSGGTLTHTGSVAVGMEPVAVAARNDDEVWVVNHLSDSVSVVDVSSTPPHVVRTLLVGDEPRDIVFAGPTDVNGDFTRAFITTARRGQNVPGSVPPLLTTEGTPRALVWVFDTTNLGATLEGVPEKILELFGDTPRALAATADGSTVYAAVFHSGNQTTTVGEGVVCNGGSGAAACNVGGGGGDGVHVTGGLTGNQVPGGLPAPNQNFQLVTGPETGLIVKFNENTGIWEDQLARNWTNGVRFNLPDLDVFEIDADAGTPAEVANFAHVGTVLFNMLVNPSNGKIYVTNTEARNEVRFEGPGNSATTVRGHLHEARITVIDGANVLPRHLNKHIDAQANGYLTTPTEAGVKEKSLATPIGMALKSDGTLYVAAFGSSQVGMFDTTELENDTFVPNAADHIELSGGGPTGLALDEANHRLYVLTRFDNAVKVVNTDTNTEILAQQRPLHNPEPAEVVNGRPFLYDARFTSSNGEASCSSCHIFADFDSLGWDLGNPDEVVMTSFNPVGPIGGQQDFHPLKGPMTTQTLRGMANHGPMHWRGDRTGAAGGNTALAFDEQLAFEAFNVAFPGLVGRDAGQIPAADMEAFANFILEVVLPPNPIRKLANQLTTAQANGRSIYLTRAGIDAAASCNGCHELDPSQGFFGANGTTTFENETQEFKVAHLSNAYQKVGMFGMPDVPFINVSVADRQHTGDQVRGFGFLHDGGIDTVFHFLTATVFIGFFNDTERRDMEDFIMAFDTTFAPIVGQQATLASASGSDVGDRITLMIQRAMANFTLVGQPGAKECELVVKGTVDGEPRGYLLNAGSGMFDSDRASESPLSDAALRAKANTPGQELTYTCAPPGSGTRMALDRDEDGFFDADELDAGTDPADPASYPGAPIELPIGAKKLLIKNKLPDDESKNKIVLVAKDAAVIIPAPGSNDDPRCGLDPPTTVKATLTFASVTSGQSHSTDLPCGNWRLIGSPGSPKGYKYKDQELNDGTAKTVLWKGGKLLKAVLQGKGVTTLDYDLQLGVGQGTVAATLESGGTKLCSVCAPSNGKDGADGKKFLGKGCPAPVACP
jgi:DNA-binding beta-propeller fold protein YncE/mono/diheme cytochrome c family protein